MPKMPVFLPGQSFLVDEVCGNPVEHMRFGPVAENLEVLPYHDKGITGHLVIMPDRKILVVTRHVDPPAGVDGVIRAQGLAPPVSTLDVSASSWKWIAPKNVPSGSTGSTLLASNPRLVLDSWRGQFRFIREEDTPGQHVDGLRAPQIGALHAALAHWTTSDEPATIVMPTGTGKTETMLALLTCARLERLLVIVPTSVLRDQVYQKFLTLGVLKSFGILGQAGMYPVVGMIRHRLGSPDDVTHMFNQCNVIVATMSVVSGCSGETQEKMAELCSHLFIDEAHHIAAPTWERFRTPFRRKPILQFTATPFRNDGRRVDGKVIYNYPLRKAQLERYLAPIDFIRVREYHPDKSDMSVASASVLRLKDDLSKSLDHVLMARTSSIKHAEHVYKIYESIAADMNPQIVHSRMSEHDKREAIQRIRARESRIVVCVDMLGEGFDLPQLKIAALHDVHKSLAITIQFIGRFTRNIERIGSAAVVANIADADVEESLESLYAEDADWNLILRRLGEEKIASEIRRSSFLEGFAGSLIDVPLQNIFPKMSTVVFRTTCTKWHPEAVSLPDLHGVPIVNEQNKTMLFVTCRREPVPWGRLRGISNIIWNLYLLHWNADQGLLFIHSSDKDSNHEDIAATVVGKTATLVQGEQVFRTLHGINRPILTNLGLNHSLSYAVRYTMYVGSDIKEGLARGQLQNRYKSNIFARGFEGGTKVSIGCSYRGRIWAHKVADALSDWVDWCHVIGAKILDDSISTKSVFDGVMVPESVKARPGVVPLTIDWSEEAYRRSEDSLYVKVDGHTVPFYEAQIELCAHREDGPICFRIATDLKSAEFEIQFTDGRVTYAPCGPERVDIGFQKRWVSLPDWFQKEPPIIGFEDGSVLVYDLHYRPPKTYRAPFDPNRIEVWNWDGIDIRKESQTLSKHSDSIQNRVIQELLSSGDFDIVFDDDGPGEVGDVIALRVQEDNLIVRLLHCKFSTEEKPGARVEDLYAVCGQAQKSVPWKGNLRGLFLHMEDRERDRLKRTGSSRFEKGDLGRLREMARQSRFLSPKMEVFIVQPGVSKSKISTRQLDLLASTEVYLLETYAVPLHVIASP